MPTRWCETPDLTKLNLGDKEFILANGTKDDADKLWAVLEGSVTPVPGIVIEATASVIKVAVTQDAKEAKIADFIVNMKKPLAEKEIPAAGFEYKLAPATELDGTYDTLYADSSHGHAGADGADRASRRSDRAGEEETCPGAQAGGRAQTRGELIICPIAHPAPGNLKGSSQQRAALFVASRRRSKESAPRRGGRLRRA